MEFTRFTSRLVAVLEIKADRFSWTSCEFKQFASRGPNYAMLIGCIMREVITLELATSLERGGAVTIGPPGTSDQL